VDIGPTDPWVKGYSVGLEIDAIEGERYIEQNFNTSKAHQSKESIRGHFIAWEYGIELRAVLIEGNDSQNGVGGRSDPDEDGWQKDDGIYWPGVIGEREAAEIFVNVKSMTLDDVFCKRCQEYRQLPAGKETYEEPSPKMADQRQLQDRP